MEKEAVIKMFDKNGKIYYVSPRSVERARKDKGWVTAADKERAMLTSSSKEDQGHSSDEVKAKPPGAGGAKKSV